ncbi:protein rep, partial [Klebsiella pneumoniae]|nr:protein rep [Klebsiella pneumoniae]
LKYSTKTADMVADPKWFLELTRQTHKRRLEATGGAPKDVLTLDQETDAELVLGAGISDGDNEGSRIAFGWTTAVTPYR